MNRAAKKPAAKKPAAAPQTDVAELDRIYEGVMSCEPALAPADLEAFADIIRSNEKFGRKWRCAAVVASKDGAFFRELAADESIARTFAPMVNVLSDFAKLLRTAADLADCAATRIMVAGCNHEKFNAWTKEATDV